MSTTEFAFSDLVRRPTEVAAAAETHRAVVLHRRGAVCRSRAGTIRHVSAVSAGLGARLWAASVDWLASPVTRLAAGGRPDQADTRHRLREPRARSVRARVSDPGGRAGSICLPRRSDR